MKRCQACGYPNQLDFNFCQRCTSPLNLPPPIEQPWVATPTTPFSLRAKVLIVAGCTFFCAVVAVTHFVTERRVREERAAADRRIGELTSEARSAIDRGDLAEADRQLAAAITYAESHARHVEKNVIARWRDLKTQCAQAADDAGAKTLVLGLDDASFARYAETGQIPDRRFFDDDGVNAYYAAKVAALKDEAPKLRAEARKREKEEAIAAAAREKEQAIAAAAREKERAAAERKKGIADRAAFGDALERKYLSDGMDVTVTVSGPENTSIRISYVLMSRPLVYQLANGGTLQSLESLGFKKVTFTDGFDDSWSYDL